MTKFQRLLGLAPAGRIAVLRTLLTGDKSLDSLVRASALPRRDVEEFLAALDGLEGDPGRLLEQYTAGRATVRTGDEADLTRAARALIEGVPAPLKRLDHVQATADTLVRRVRWLTGTFDLSGRSVLFVGDHDVTSLLLHQVVPDTTLTVADLDERLLAYVDERSGSRVRCAYADFRFGLPPALAGSADVIVTDPPYTPEGLGLFLVRSLQALRRDEPDARIVVAYGHSRRRPDLGVAAQREILRHDLAIDAMLPAFNSYDGAQAVGSASDLYVCQPTPRAFRRLDQLAREGSPHSGAHGIYTHGEQSVEAAPRAAEALAALLPDLPLSGGPLSGGALSGGPLSGRPSSGQEPSAGHGSLGLVSAEPAAGSASHRNFAATISLSKLLADGVHPSVTARAGEWVVDLRDDPGPWLLRAMLALNAGAAVFVTDARHEALRDLSAGVGPWSLVRAKFEAVSVGELPEHGLAAVRCLLAAEDASGTSGTSGAGGNGRAGGTGSADGTGGRAEDPGLALARLITRRAHGKLRNIWREALITLAARDGQSLTKRAAADLTDAAAAAAGSGNDLPLRLMDVPAAHFPALRAALIDSTAHDVI